MIVKFALIVTCHIIIFIRLVGMIVAIWMARKTK